MRIFSSFVLGGAVLLRVAAAASVRGGAGADVVEPAVELSSDSVNLEPPSNTSQQQHHHHQRELATYCGCPGCTDSVWNTNACAWGQCYTCGARISWLQTGAGGSKTESQACTQVSNEFANGPCGPACNPNTCNATPDPTPVPTPVPTKDPTPEPTPSPTPNPTTPAPTPNPTTPAPTPNPTTPAPTPKPTEQTFCGCPGCTDSIWNTDACAWGQCYTCGARISWLQTGAGGSKTEAQACTQVSNEFANGPCGPACNPQVCNVTPSPTEEPTPKPTPAPTPAPTPSPTQKTHCGCPECTDSIWNTSTCDGGGCYTCGGRISWLQTGPGGSKTEAEACAQVSYEFSNNECGPACNPDLCNPEFLDEPDASKLVWSDEFEVDGSPDSSKWDYDLGDGCSIGICGWGNGELQDYTRDASNVVVANGVLRITAHRDGNDEYTSARVITRGKQQFKYGRMRFRANLANCQAVGTWPALWMLPEQNIYGNWPNSGEIDIMESVGHEADKFFGTVHTGAFNHAINTQMGGHVFESKSEWHVFEIEWQVDRIKFAIDGRVYYEFAPSDLTKSAQWPFNQDFHLLMNIAVGGSWGGAQGVDSASFDGDGQYMEVDWVRFYSG